MLTLHLIDSLSTRYTANKYSENRTDGAYALVYRTYTSTVAGETNPSSVLLILASSVRWRNFF